MTDIEISNTIVYLRPRTEEAIRALNDDHNSHLAEKIDPPCDYADESRAYGEPLESSNIHPRVLRLGFNDDQKDPKKGFMVGTGSESDIVLPNYGNHSTPGYFRIRYNFDSGALLITALRLIQIGGIPLQQDHSLLPITGTTVECGSAALQFTFEFPDLSQCASEHEANYQAYMEKLEVTNAPYMATSADEDPLIGPDHRRKVILGRGGFGEVYKAVNIRSGALCAIKWLDKKEIPDHSMFE